MEMLTKTKMTGYPSQDRPWVKYYSHDVSPDQFPVCTIYELLKSQNSDNLDTVALNYFGTKITFGNLFKKIEEAASAFRAIGVREGEIVTICGVAQPEIVYSIYGLSYIGAVPNMIDPRTSPSGIEAYIKEVDSHHIVLLDSSVDKLEKCSSDLIIEKAVVVAPHLSMPPLLRAGYAARNKKVRLSNEHYIEWNSFIKLGKEKIEPLHVPTGKTAAIVHTGGTTGPSKGVMLSHDNMNALAFQFAQGFRGFERGNRFLDVIPPFVAYGMCGGIHTPLTCGITDILIPKFDPDEFDELIVKYRPTNFMGVPAYFIPLMKSEKMRDMDLSFIACPAVGGDGMSVELEKKANDFLMDHNAPRHVAKGYGMTEVCSAACGAIIDDCNELGSVGVPLPGNVISVFETGTHRELSYNQEGEVCISGPTVMNGYYDNPDETAHVLQKHEDGRVWVHSGDIGYMTEDGILHVVGRLKRVIIKSGWNLYPSVIENAIMKHPHISACAVVGIEDPVHKHVPKAFIVPKQYVTDTSNLLDEVRQCCIDNLPEHSVPELYKLCEALPMTNIGKVDYKALEKDV